MKSPSSLHHWLPAILLVLSASYFTYLRGYAFPSFIIWDENYHIASAQKYLNKVFFMECHPPLGKLLIALGEMLLSPNADTTGYISRETVQVLPSQFKMNGVRLLPTLAGWGAACLTFVFAAIVSRSPWLALICASPIIFDNATIVHSRAAMLDSFTIFFFMASLVSFAALLSFHSGNRPLSTMLLRSAMGLSIGCALATKANTVVLLIMPLFYLFLMFSQSLRKGFIASAQFLPALALGIIVPWGIHISRGININPTLNNSGLYGASTPYQEFLDSGGSVPLQLYPTIVSDNLRFARSHHQAVPQFKPNSPHENGSPPWHWPLGGKAIRYHIQTQGDKTAYLYLQSNPAVWGLGLLSLLLGVYFLCSQRKKYPTHWTIALALVSMYLLYMGMVMTLKRVLYLYHYLLPLHISLLLGVIVMCAFWPNFTRIVRGGIGSLVIILVLAGYIVFYPLTYNIPISSDHFRSLNWLPIWQLRCGNCK